MARIAGVNLPAQKHVWVGLQSIYGIGRTRSKKVCDSAGVESTTKIRDLSEPEVERLRGEVGKFVVEGDLLEQRVDVIVNPWNRNIIPWWLLLPPGLGIVIICLIFMDMGRWLEEKIDPRLGGGKDA